jgi:hypothetical protein
MVVGLVEVFEGELFHSGEDLVLRSELKHVEGFLRILKVAYNSRSDEAADIAPLGGY